MTNQQQIPEDDIPYSLDDELRQLDEWLQSTFEGLNRPDPQDLVDVITGQATKQQELLVATYRRNSQRGRREFEALQIEHTELSKRRKFSWQAEPLVFFATPVLQLVGLRGGGIASSSDAHKGQSGIHSSTEKIVYTLRPSREQDVNQNFEVTDIDMQVALHMPRVKGELYELQGTVTQYAQLVNKAEIVLRSSTGRVRKRKTNEAGFFLFSKLAPGDYRLNIKLEDGTILIDGLLFDVP